MTLRMAVLLVCGLSALCGGTLLLKSLATPAWTDQGRVDETITRDPEAAISGSKEEYAAFNARWFRDMDTLRTSKWPLFDLATGLIALALSISASAFLLGVRTRSSVAALQTPSQRWVLFLLVALVWLPLYGVFYHSIMQGFLRVDYPPWADSIIIPIFEIAVAMLVIFPFVAALVWFGALRKAKLPARMWLWDSARPVRSWGSAVISGSIVVLALFVIVDAFRFGPYSAIPAMLLTAYLALALRATIVSG